MAAWKSTPQPLTLYPDPAIVSDANNAIDAKDSFIASPESPLTPKSPKSPKSPRSPFKFSSSKKQPQPQPQPQPESQSQGAQPPMHPAKPQLSRSTLPVSQTTPSLSALQQQSVGILGGEERQERERTSRSGFFSNYKASKSSSRLQENAFTVRQVSEDNMSRDTDRPAIAGKVSSQERSRTETSVDRSIKRRPVGEPARTSDTSLNTSTNQPPSSSDSNSGRKTKPKPFSILSRTKSIRDEQSPRESPLSNKIMEQQIPMYTHSNAIRTAPLRADSDRSFREMMNSNVRQRSEDRKPAVARDSSLSKDQKENNRPQQSFSTFRDNVRENGSHGFLNNLRSAGTKGAGVLSKGLFGKGGRNGSTNQKEHAVDDEHYDLKVINKPLIEQTRLTRISKRLEDSRDKTEFWMPAFPWRAIDYLNYKGSEVEGLYRVPGSGPQIKRWQRRFDEELDIDLFEQDDLYDINIIGSMLKAWLRELPDELFPKAAQDRVARQCAPSETVPILLTEELSNLPPFNYYLLFAITCHLSLLLAHSDKNKMDYRNLCICFQPCMKIDAFCFKFLVCDWRECWKGCKTEEQYVQQEYSLFDPLPPSSAEGRSSTALESHDERNVSSSDSSKPSSVSIDKVDTQKKLGSVSGKVDSRKLPFSQTHGSLSTIQSTTLTVVQERTPTKRSQEMRPLSPIKPLSPIGL